MDIISELDKLTEQISVIKTECAKQSQSMQEQVEIANELLIGMQKAVMDDWNDKLSNNDISIDTYTNSSAFFVSRLIDRFFYCLKKIPVNLASFPRRRKDDAK